MEEQNPLIPVFLKTNRLQFLIIGGGYTAWEKLNTLLNNTDHLKVRVVAEEFIYPKFLKLVQENRVAYEQKSYTADDLDGVQIAISATNNPEVNKLIREDCIKRNVVLNAADNPENCDFYLGSIVTKGSLKIAISTNGKSPTMAKRLKEMLNEVIPNTMEDILNNLRKIRDSLKMSFEEKVDTLNKITQNWKG